MISASKLQVHVYLALEFVIHALIRFKGLDGEFDNKLQIFDCAV